MKMKIKLPNKGTNIKEIRKMFKEQVAQPLEKAFNILGYDDYFGFVDDDLLDDTLEHNNEAPEIASGFFNHLECDMESDDHYFKFWSNGRGIILNGRAEQCSLCKKAKITGTWAKIIGLLIKMVRKDLERMNAKITNIEKIGKEIILK